MTLNGFLACLFGNNSPYATVLGGLHHIYKIAAWQFLHPTAIIFRDLVRKLEVLHRPRQSLIGIKN